MSDWPVGLSTGCFYTQSFFDCIDSIVKNGFTMLEICSSPQHLDYHDESAVKEAARILEAGHVESYSFHAPFSEKIDITSLDETARTAAAEEIIRAAKAASMLNARYFVLHPGPEKSYTVSPEERMERMKNAAGVLDRICEQIAEMGVGVVIENMLPHLFCGNISEMTWLLGSIKSVIPGACLDTGHAYLSKNLYNVMYKLSGHLAMVHANDNTGSGDDHLPPGKGDIDWKKLLWELGQTGFRGSLMLEIAGNDQVDAEPLLYGARESRLYLRRLMKDLALSKPPTVAYGRMHEGREE
ncbi:MAG: TIM barrel protein [Chitinivibrionales bacterium]|nr:TIM barrel protein [Chitinivibrionales bacterium]